MENDNSKLSIFLCHASEDKKTVRALYERLHADSFDVWLDDEKLLPGQDWELEIRKAIRQSNVVIVCLSTNSLTKEGFIQKEIKIALNVAEEKPEGTIFIIPVRLEDCEIPDRLSKWQYVDFFAEDGYERLTKSLIKRASDLVGKISKTKGKTNKDHNDNSSEESRSDIGVSFDSQGKSIITITPTVFFDHRLRSAFPGIRGLNLFENSKEALDRLEILLRYPLKFDEGQGYEVMTDPVWWFRGSQASSIRSLLRLNENKFVLDDNELSIKKFGVFRSDFYWQSFIYIETYGEEPIGIYSHTQDTLENMVGNWGYADEEYAIFDGTPISRESYDDGAAVIEGKVIDIMGAELRVRYLTDYNFVIASKFSPINSMEFQRNSKQFFDGILGGTHQLDNLLNYITQLPRHRKDE